MIQRATSWFGHRRRLDHMKNGVVLNIEPGAADAEIGARPDREPQHPVEGDGIVQPVRHDCEVVHSADHRVAPKVIGGGGIFMSQALAMDERAILDIELYSERRGCLRPNACGVGSSSAPDEEDCP